MARVIGVDLDGVVVDVCVPIINYLKRKKHIEYTHEHFTHYNTYEWANVTKEEMVKLFSGVAGYRDAPLMPEVWYSMHHLVQNGFELVAVTSRPKSVEKYTMDWINKEQLPFSTVYFTDAHEKINIAKELEMEVFIEDNPVTATQMLDVCDRVFIFDAKYNRHLVESNRLIRVYKWVDILGVLLYGYM